MNPIWRDYNVTLGYGTYFDYTIIVDGVTAFAGRAYSHSGEAEYVSIKVNDIVADYLQRTIPTFYDEILPVTIYGATAKVKVGSTELAEETFFADWSYDRNYQQARDGLCFPIDGWISNNQHLLYSDLGSVDDITMHLTYQGPHPDFQPWTAPGHGSFNSDFLIMADSEDITLDGDGTEGQPRVFPIHLWDYSDLAEVYIGGYTWKVWPGCCRYVLHYINAFGGWDSFLIRGNFKQTDSVKRYNHKIPYNNRWDDQERGTDTYVAELTPKYVLHSGMLTENQASRMHHLLNSCCVYLEDMQEDKVLPVVLTNSSTEHKTWDNQGHRLIEYTIEAELAQERIRR